MPHWPSKHSKPSAEEIEEARLDLLLRQDKALSVQLADTICEHGQTLGRLSYPGLTKELYAQWGQQQADLESKRKHIERLMKLRQQGSSKIECSILQERFLNGNCGRRNENVKRIFELRGTEPHSEERVSLERRLLAVELVDRLVDEEGWRVEKERRRKEARKLEKLERKEARMRYLSNVMI